MNQTESSATASLGTRIGATFTSPSALPRLLPPGLPWLDVLLISTAIAIASVATVPDEFFLQSMSDPVSRRGEPVEIVSSPDVVARWGRGMGMLATVTTHPTLVVAIAGALVLVFSIFLRGPGSFRDYLSLTAHAMLIPAVGTLLTIGVRLTTNATSITELLTFGEPASFASALLLSVDPFVVWMLVAIALAIPRLDERRSAATSGMLLIGTYLVLVLASTALLHRELLG